MCGGEVFLVVGVVPFLWIVVACAWCVCVFLTLEDTVWCLVTPSFGGGVCKFSAG